VHQHQVEDSNLGGQVPPQSTLLPPLSHDVSIKAFIFPHNVSICLAGLTPYLPSKIPNPSSLTLFSSPLGRQSATPPGCRGGSPLRLQNVEGEGGTDHGWGEQGELREKGSLPIKCYKEPRKVTGRCPLLTRHIRNGHKKCPLLQLVTGHVKWLFFWAHRELW
jgi:hypothetical protein